MTELAGLYFIAAVGILCLTAMGAVIVMGALASRSARHAARGRQQALPLLVNVLDGEFAGSDQDLGRSRRRELEILVASTARKVSGSDREQLVRWLIEAGVSRRAKRDMASRSAPRRIRALSLFCACAGADEFAPVIAMLRDRHPRVRTAAALELGSNGVRDAIPHLLASLSSRRAPIRPLVASMAILRALPRTANDLHAAWSSTDPQVQRVGIEVAGLVGLSDAAGHLEGFLLSRNPAVRGAAATALSRIGPPGLEAMLTKQAAAYPVTVAGNRHPANAGPGTPRELSNEH